MEPTKTFHRLLEIAYVSFSLLIMVGCASLNPQSRPPNPLWLTDFERAKETARSQKLPILAAFVGSDWCPWSMSWLLS